MDWLTLSFLRSFDLFFNLESFTRVDDVDNCTRSGCFEVFEECTCMTTISIG